MMKKNIEEKTAATILQEEGVAVIGKKRYHFPQPTTATLIALSAEVAKLPRTLLDSNDVVGETLRVAKHCAPIGRAVAILLTGAKGFTRKGWRRRIFDWRIERTASHLLEELSPTDLQNLATALLMRSDVSSFFAVTAFLAAANMTKATKADEATASGLQ